MKKLVLDLLLKLITDDVSKRFVIEFLRKQARDDGKTPLSIKEYCVAYTPDTSVTDLYAHLKTLPDFSGATDV